MEVPFGNDHFHVPFDHQSWNCTVPCFHPIQGIVGCTPTNVPRHGKSLYKPYNTWVSMGIPKNPKVDHQRKIPWWYTGIGVASLKLTVRP